MPKAWPISDIPDWQTLATYNCRVCGNRQRSDFVATLDSGYRLVRCRHCRVKASQPMPSDSSRKGAATGEPLTHLPERGDFYTMGKTAIRVTERWVSWLGGSGSGLVLVCS